jgi:hypothetical protein
VTEIAIHQPANAVAVPDQQPPGTDLILWARQAEAAALYAERVCSTTMAPAAYRGKPAEAAAAILAGAELGFSPMASLRAFDNIQGTPAPKAMTLRAVVQAAGHEVRIVESTDERAVVDGRRKGDIEWQTSIWDIARAQKLAQFKTNPNYKTNPAQMLAARATAEVCRWVGADAIMGMPYAAEEIDGPEHAPAPVARRLAIADLDEPADVDIPSAIEHAPADEHVTRDQQKHMFALWNELGFGGDENREQRLAVTAKILGFDELESSDELTSGEAHQVITALIERKARMKGGDR